MEALDTLVTRVQRGDPSAFEDIVRRFQDMAVGYGYSVLGDMALAEDAAQEAFLNAYRDLPMLRDPAAFPGWLRRIVFKHIDRVRRRRGAQSVSLDLVREMSSHAPGPAEAAESRAVHDQVFAAIAQLPAHQRSVVTLFYIHDFSQEEKGYFCLPLGGGLRRRESPSGPEPRPGKCRRPQQRHPHLPRLRPGNDPARAGPRRRPVDEDELGARE